MKLNKIHVIAILILAITALEACNTKDKPQSDNSILVESDSTAFGDEDGLIDYSDSSKVMRDYTNSLSTLVNEVSDGLNDIKNLERIVTNDGLSNETTERKEQVRNDILLIKSSVQDRMNRLAELEDQLTRSEAKAKYSEEERQSMLNTITDLRKQLTEQQQRIDALTAQLDAAKTTINNLNQKVDSLKTVNNNVTNENIKAKEEAQKAREEALQLSNELNECFYAIGTNKELKAHKIIESGFLRKTKVMQSNNIMLSYFTKADKRTLNEINLRSKKAKVLTNHDSQSYGIVDVGGMKVLRIYNHNLFWQYTNYLVIQVD